MIEPPFEDVLQAVRSRREWAEGLLADLVRHPTILGQEEEAQRHLAGVMESLGLEVEFVPMNEDLLPTLPGYSPTDWPYHGKLNVQGIHRPHRVQGRSLTFNGHIDVVSPEPVALWSSPPFRPRKVEEDGDTWMYGRGTGDMKGGTVSYLWALAALRDLGLAPAAQVVCQSPVEEECTGNGTLALLHQGPRTEACVIPEPFDHTVLVRQVGVVWFQVRVRGHTAHVLGAGRGVNAIERSWPIIQALRQLESEENRPERIPEGYRDMEHPLNLNVGVIRGGDWASTVAGECVTRYRFGLFPGESLAALRKRIEARVAEAARDDPFLSENPPRVEYVGFQAEGCTFDPECDLGQALHRAHAAHHPRPALPLNATCTTDVRHFNLYHGIPATCYGPRSTSIHGVDERVSLGSMERVAAVFLHLVRDWCGLERISP